MREDEEEELTATTRVPSGAEGAACRLKTTVSSTRIVTVMSAEVSGTVTLSSTSRAWPASAGSGNAVVEPGERDLN